MRKRITLDHRSGNPHERHRILLLGQTHGRTNHHGSIRQIRQSQQPQSLLARRQRDIGNAVIHNLELIRPVDVPLQRDIALAVGNIERAGGQETAEHPFKKSEEPLLRFGELPCLERVGVGCVEHFRHMAADGRGTSDDAGLRAVAVEDVGPDLLDEPADMQPRLDVIACGKVPDQFGNGNKRRMLFHFGNRIAIVIIDAIGSVSDGHVKFAVVDTINDEQPFLPFHRLGHVASPYHWLLITYERGRHSSFRIIPSPKYVFRVSGYLFVDMPSV